MNPSCLLPAPFLNGLVLDGEVCAPPGSAFARGSHEWRSSLFLEGLGVEDAQGCAAEWEDLASRALEPNIYFEPGFALNAARHVPSARKPEFLFCWESDATDARGRLLGVWPLLAQKAGFLSMARSWSHDYGCSSAPLLDRDFAPLVLEAMISWLRGRGAPPLAVQIPLLVTANAAHAAMSAYARREGLRFDLVAQHDRAALDATQPGVRAWRFVSPKKRKELRRQDRRLRDLGAVAFHVTQDVDDLREQIEAFMLLEARGWKGRKGTAFLSDPGLSAFLRAMSRTLGREGKCRVFWLSLDEKMIAANIVLQDGSGNAYFWKTAYDEDYAHLSPGVLLTMDMTDRLLDDQGVIRVDSCAVADHPMINHLWRGRLRVAEVMLAVAPDRALAFSGLLRLEKFRRAMRESAKSALARIGMRT